MNKQEFVASLAKKYNLSLDEAGKACDMVFQELVTQMEHREDVRIRNFGTFCVRIHQAKEFQDFNTGQKKTLPAHYRPVFVASDSLKDRVRMGVSKNEGNHPNSV